MAEAPRSLTSERTVDVAGVGLNATDTLIPVKQFPERGSKIEIQSANVMLGGQVASAMVACQQWGLRTRYVGKLGEDRLAELHRAEFRRLGIETHLLMAPGCGSQQAFILVDAAGERTVLWKRDHRLTLLPEELDAEWIRNAGVLHLDGHDTAAAALAARYARGAGVPVVADLDDLYSGVEELLPNIDYLITSRDIPRRLTGNEDLRCSLPEVQRRYGARLAAATLGSDGVLAWDGQKFHYAPAYRVQVVDTTGAGDSFAAGLAFGYLAYRDYVVACQYGNAMGAQRCTGAELNVYLSREETERQILATYGPRSA